MTGRIICIMGRSRAGKDSIAKALKPRLNATIRKFSAPAKRYIEMAYGLPEFALEKDEYRNALVPDSDKTYLDLLIYSYTAYDSIDPLFWIRPSFLAITELIKTNKQTVILTDLRRTEEADMVVSLVESTGADLYVVHVSRPGLSYVSTDANLGRNINTLSHKAVSFDCYINNDSINHLETFAQVYAENLESFA